MDLVQLHNKLKEPQEWLAVGDNVPDLWKVILAVCTGLGAWGGFPVPPRAFNSLVESELVQYGLVWVLLWQGGSGENWKLASLITSIMYVLHRLLD